jgi:hypothetical protein
MTRLRRLIATALVDSFGLSLGWTVFSLHVVRGHGLAGLGLCNAAMLCGVALSAPAAARLSARLDGRALLRVTAVTEAALRVGTFVLLLAGTPLVVVAAAVAASNVVAWTGYAGMRAEVAAADPRGAAMTWYMVAVAAIEAAGTATAALLPRGPDGLVTGSLLFAVITCYGACLLPTWLVAGGARVGRVEAVGRAENGVGVGPVALPRPGVQAAPPAGSLAGALTGPLAGLLASGGLVMLLGSARPCSRSASPPSSMEQGGWPARPSPSPPAACSPPCRWPAWNAAPSPRRSPGPPSAWAWSPAGPSRPGAPPPSWPPSSSPACA